jgi:hypothetical protein
MNVQLFSFCLFLLWLGVTLIVFVFGPLFYPKMFQDTSRLNFLGFGAGMLTIWNFVKWWSIRQRFRHLDYRKELEEAYRRRINPTSEESEKPVINPEFQFEESRTRIPPPPPPNGTSH